MNKRSKEFKELVYDLVNGALDLEEYPVEESKYVKNEYEEDSLCAKLYSDMRDAYDRVCARLGTEVSGAQVAVAQRSQGLRQAGQLVLGDAHSFCRRVSASCRVSSFLAKQKRTMR